MILLELKNESYPPILMEAWEKGDYSFLRKSAASDYIKKILIHKAQARPGKRFFGEAYIASRIEMVDGWYNSYKWLTESKWLSGYGLKPEFEGPFHKALTKHFEKESLVNLQEKASLLFKNYRSDFFDCGRYRKPVAPDLWLVTLEGAHIFLESKLPEDCVKASQLAGLALIRKCLGESKKVQVSVINLYPEGSTPKGEKDALEAFSYFYKVA